MRIRALIGIGITAVAMGVGTAHDRYWTLVAGIGVGILLCAATLRD